MLEANVTKEKTTLTIAGTMPQIMSDLTNLIRAINKSLEKNNAGHEFRIMFTKATMDGLFFDENRESAEQYLREGDKALDDDSIVNSEKKLIDAFLKGLIDALGEDSNEAE